MAAKKSATPKKSTEKMSKAAFVRTLPPQTPAKVVVAKAKERGMVLTESYVYNVRGAAKAAKRKRGSGQSYAQANLGSAPTGGQSTEELLRAVGADVGLTRAIEILQAERARVHAVLRA